MLLAKCCHDIDLITWLMSGVAPVSVDSMGGLHFFNKANAPENSGTHCMLNCPLEKTCDYSVRRLHLEHPLAWNAYVWPSHAYTPELNNHEQRLKEAMQPDFPHSRCVWKCNNNQIDRQCVMITFADGTVATHDLVTNTARPMRKIHIVGTAGEIEGVFDENKFVIRHRDLDPTKELCDNTEEVTDINNCGDTTGITGDHGGGKGKQRMAGYSDHGGHGAAQGEGTVGGHIGDVQYPEAEEQGKGHQGIDKAQLHRTHNNSGRDHNKFS